MILKLVCKSEYMKYSTNLKVQIHKNRMARNLCFLETVLTGPMLEHVGHWDGPIRLHEKLLSFRPNSLLSSGAHADDQQEVAGCMQFQDVICTEVNPITYIYITYTIHSPSNWGFMFLLAKNLIPSDRFQRKSAHVPTMAPGARGLRSWFCQI